MSSSTTFRVSLLESVKTNPKDLDAWARLIRFDADAACLLSGSSAAEAWKAVDRLSSQAFLANKDSVKQRPLAYISFTIDQARAQMRISGAATAKKVLRSVASLPEVKSSWPFYRTLAILEAMQGDAASVKRVLDMCREKMVKQGGVVTDEFEAFDETLRLCNNRTSSSDNIGGSEKDDASSLISIFASKFSIDAVQPSLITNPSPAGETSPSTVVMSSSSSNPSLFIKPEEKNSVTSSSSSSSSNISPPSVPLMEPTSTDTSTKALPPPPSTTSSSSSSSSSLQSSKTPLPLISSTSRATTVAPVVPPSLPVSSGTGGGRLSMSIGAPATAATRRMSLMRTSFISSLSPVAENKVSRRSIAPGAKSTLSSNTNAPHHQNSHPSVNPTNAGGGGGGDDMDVSGDDATTVVSGSSVESSRSSNNTTATTTMGLGNSGVNGGGGITTSNNNNTLFNASATVTSGSILSNAARTASSSSSSAATTAVPLAGTTSGNGVKKASSSTASAFVIPDYIRDFKANSGSSSSSSSSSSGRPGSSSASLSTSTSASGVTKKEEKSATGSLAAANGSDQNQSVVILQPRSQRQQQQQQQQQTAASVADNAVTSSISPQSFNVVSSDRSGGASSSSSSSEGEGDSGESGPTVVLQPRYSGNNANNRVSAGSQQQQQRGNNQRQQQQQQQQESLDESSFDEGETVAPQPIQQVQQQQQRVSNTSNKMQQQQQQQQQQVNSVDSEYQQQHSPSPTTVFGSLGASNEVVRVGQRNYLRLACIGRGGSSRVYRVLGEDMNLYALKRVRLARMDHASVDVYKNEINLMKRLAGNRHIIKLMDAEVAYESRCIHMVMECGQADLNALLQSEQERAHTRMASEGTNARPSLMVDENQLRLVWQQMLEAVQTIHEARIVHGDLKPANFVFVEGVLKLIDFGIAKAISNDTTNIVRDSQVGTINYMSPEAIMDTSGGGKFPSSSSSRAPVLKQGRASDIWSLGCILYQMAYGKTPFADLSLIHKLHSICDPNYSIHFADCGSPALVQVLQSCLQRDPSKRPPILDSEGGGLLNHPFLRPHLSPHSSNQATRSAIEILSRCAPGEAVVLTREQLNKALILAGSLGAERAVAPFVAPSEVPVFVSEACARITDELLALGEPGAGTELPNGLQDELKAAARKPSSPVPAALLKATSLKSVNNGPINSNSTGSSSVTASSMTSTSTSSTRPLGSQASIPTPAVAVPNLQEAIASKAASLRHVDKENLVKSSSSSSSLGFIGDGGGGGGLLAAMRKGLNEKFAHARPVAAPGGDTSILDITGTWGMPT